MKIICSGDANNTKILTDSGEDITQQMGITDMSIHLSANGMPSVKMTCCLFNIDFEVAQENALACVSILPNLTKPQATQLNKLIKSWTEPK